MTSPELHIMLDGLTLAIISRFIGMEMETTLAIVTPIVAL
jgi:hypothetical protein